MIEVLPMMKVKFDEDAETRMMAVLLPLEEVRR